MARGTWSAKWAETNQVDPVRPGAAPSGRWNLQLLTAWILSGFEMLFACAIFVYSFEPPPFPSDALPGNKSRLAGRNQSGYDCRELMSPASKVGAGGEHCYGRK
jgi:hypothetical protein